MSDNVIRAERFELLDAKGNVRALLSCEEDTGVPSCVFYDAKGEARVIVGLSWNDMPQIQLAAPDGTARVALVVRPEGTGMIVLADGDQKTKALTATT